MLDWSSGIIMLLSNNAAAGHITAGSNFTNLECLKDVKIEKSVITIELKNLIQSSTFQDVQFEYALANDYTRIASHIRS